MTRESRLKPAIVLKLAMPSVSQQQLIDLAADRVGPLERRGRRQLHVQQEVAVVLLGHEAGRQPPAEHAGRDA